MSRKYDFGDEVVIKKTGKHGTITGRYWHNDDLIVTWMVWFAPMNSVSLRDEEIELCRRYDGW